MVVIRPYILLVPVLLTVFADRVEDEDNDHAEQTRHVENIAELELFTTFTGSVNSHVPLLNFTNSTILKDNE
jgi:hypothetical protein